MREKAILELISNRIASAGDDAAVVPFEKSNLVLTTDMLHRFTDFPAATSPMTIGWRSVAVSLSDLAAMGARPIAVLLALGDRDLKEGFVEELMDGATACCESVGSRLVGGDIDRHSELTLVSSAIGESKSPVKREGAQQGDAIYVTGELGRTAAALRLFKLGQLGRADELFRFAARCDWGQAIAGVATSMIDISDGLARSLHLIAGASGVGATIESNLLPRLPEVDRLFPRSQNIDTLLYGGEDYELLFTAPQESVQEISGRLRFSAIGEVTKERVLLDNKEIPNKGYEH